MPHIVVLGSLNMDLVMRVANLPRAGETLRGQGFATAPGGKGGNQAVACARMGGCVSMVGLTGADAFGAALRRGLEDEAIDVRHLGADPAAPTGVAVILVEESGENRIMLAPGANDALSPAHVAAAGPLIDTAGLLVVQLEVPLPTVRAAISRAAAAGVRVLFNPAPAQALPADFLAQVDTLVVNETEAGTLTGAAVETIEGAEAAGRALKDAGARQVIVTLGARGIVITDELGPRHAPAFAAAAVDTTAAGDSFIGGLAAGMMEGMTLDEAARLGMRAAAIAVTRHGAQPSIPYRRELAAYTNPL